MSTDTKAAPAGNKAMHANDPVKSSTPFMPGPTQPALVQTGPKATDKAKTAVRREPVDKTMPTAKPQTKRGEAKPKRKRTTKAKAKTAKAKTARRRNVADRHPFGTCVPQGECVCP